MSLNEVPPVAFASDHDTFYYREYIMHKSANSDSSSLYPLVPSTIGSQTSSRKDKSADSTASLRLNGTSTDLIANHFLPLAVDSSSGRDANGHADLSDPSDRPSTAPRPSSRHSASPPPTKLRFLENSLSGNDSAVWKDHTVPVPTNNLNGIAGFDSTALDEANPWADLINSSLSSVPSAHDSPAGSISREAYLAADGQLTDFGRSIFWQNLRRGLAPSSNGSSSLLSSQPDFGSNHLNSNFGSISSDPAASIGSNVIPELSPFPSLHSSQRTPLNLASLRSSQNGSNPSSSSRYSSTRNNDPIHNGPPVPDFAELAASYLQTIESDGLTNGARRKPNMSQRPYRPGPKLADLFIPEDTAGEEAASGPTLTDLLSGRPPSGHAPSETNHSGTIQPISPNMSLHHRPTLKRHLPEFNEDDDRVLVGTKIDQNHANYVTMYNMLTGIRVSVSSTTAKMDRQLTPFDFSEVHKYTFDVTGNVMLPSSKYDFKFKDYAPWVFRHLRSTFGLDSADYLLSLTSKYILSELGSPGKSGSFFYYSRDYKYIIKTIHYREHKFLRKILPHYYEYVQKNPNTLISQFYGLHRVKMPYGRKIHFVIMNNLFPAHRDIHKTYDLKGSTIGRELKEHEIAANPRAVRKDLNWLRGDEHIELGPYKESKFTEQLDRDVRLLRSLNVMDYSLLVGIHDLNKGNEERLREKTLHVYQPEGEDEPDQAAPAPGLTRSPSRLESARKVKELRESLRSHRPVPLARSNTEMTNNMFEGAGEDRTKHIFYKDDGGFRASLADNSPGDKIYYLGIIDCLTKYNFIKKAEHFFKGFKHPEPEISAIPPARYGGRFARFIRSVIKT